MVWATAGAMCCDDGEHVYGSWFLQSGCRIWMRIQLVFLRLLFLPFLPGLKKQEVELGAIEDDG